MGRDVQPKPVYIVPEYVVPHKDTREGRARLTVEAVILWIMVLLFIASKIF